MARSVSSLFSGYWYGRPTNVPNTFNIERLVNAEYVNILIPVCHKSTFIPWCVPVSTADAIHQGITNGRLNDDDIITINIPLETTRIAASRTVSDAFLRCFMGSGLWRDTIDGSLVFYIGSGMVFDETMKPVLIYGETFGTHCLERKLLLDIAVYKGEVPSKIVSVIKNSVFKNAINNMNVEICNISEYIPTFRIPETHISSQISKNLLREVRDNVNNIFYSI